MIYKNNLYLVTYRYSADPGNMNDFVKRFQGVWNTVIKFILVKVFPRVGNDKTSSLRRVKFYRMFDSTFMLYSPASFSQFID